MRIVSVVGTRPNFVKMAPVIAELRRRQPGEQHLIVHTGQHYDRLMSSIFLDELGMPEPDYMLGAGSGGHAEQTGRVMERLEPILQAERPDVVIVPGDVNSTLAAALVAAKLQIPIAHVEAGLRSFDRSMPEEVNRLLTDRVSDYLFIHSRDAADNLEREGIPGECVHFVGNTMIDTLVALRPRFEKIRAAERLGLVPGRFLLVTLHRPALVDGPLLEEVMNQLGRVAEEIPVLFPAHPRTLGNLAGAELHPRIKLSPPIGYMDFLSLEAGAGAVLTDSGGVQEETTYLNVPCFTLRANTERPVTVAAGTNTVLGLEPERIADIPAALHAHRARPGGPPEGWDGHAAERLADVLVGPQALPAMPPDPASARAG